MDVSENSLANLVPGRVTTRAQRVAGKNMIIGKIIEALRPSVQDDDSVRRFLCKAWDFEVTEAARLKVLRGKAEAVYSAIFDGIKNKVAGGEAVSINGFATFRKVVQPTEIEVALWGDTVYSGTYYPILPTDKIITVNRTARMGPQSWDGVTIGDEYFLNGMTFASENELWQAETGAQFPWQGRRWSVSLSQYAYVDSVASDGVESSKLWYHTTENLSGSLTLREKENGDWQAYLIVSAQDKQEFIAKRELLKSKKLEDLEARSVARGAISGVCVDEFLRAWPMKRRLVVSEGTVIKRMELLTVTPEEYRVIFGWDEYRMRQNGTWRERVRNFGNSVEVKFRDEFIEATQAPV